MKKKAFRKIAAALSAAAIFASAVPFGADADGAMKIVALGDSITNGYSKDGSLIASYAELVSSYYGADLVNFSADGSKSADVLAKLSDPVVQSELAGADLVLITVGGNDIMQPILNNEYINTGSYPDIPSLVDDIKKKNDADPLFMFAFQSYLNGTVSKPGVIPTAIQECNSNVNQISEALSTLTNGKIIFQTVYNPLDFSADDTSYSSNTSISALSTNLTNYFEGKENNMLYPADGGINDIIRNQAAAAQTYVTDTFVTFKGHSYFYTHIGDVDVHPNNKGHLAIAEEIINMLALPETGRENGTLLRRVYTASGAEQTLGGVNAAINEGVLNLVLVNSYGDVDADGAVNISDATSALKIYAAAGAGSLCEITGVNAQAADADRNGKVDLGDATLMLSYYASKAAGTYTGSFTDYVFLNAQQ